jgi:hypothetical protein
MVVVLAGSAMALDMSGIVYREDFNGSLSGGGTVVDLDGASHVWGSDHLQLVNDGWKKVSENRGAYVDLPDYTLQNAIQAALPAPDAFTSLTFEMFVDTTEAHWNSGYFGFGSTDQYGSPAPGNFVGYSGDYIGGGDYGIARWTQMWSNYYQELPTTFTGNPEPASGASHIALVFDCPTDYLWNVQIWQDGVLVGYVDKSAAIGETLKGLWPLYDGLFGDTFGYIGRGIPDWDDALLSAKIYDFRIWGKALTPAEIGESIALGSEIPEPATMALLALGSVLLRRRK